MAKKKSCNAYEEARKKRLQENLERFQELGIQKISKSLKESSSTKKSSSSRAKPKVETMFDVLELRRSSRARNHVPSYSDDVRPEDLQFFRRRYARKRPSNGINLASYEERCNALKAAEKLQKNLKPGHPSFVKSMGLPIKFCKDHLPRNDTKMVLEDKNGAEYDTIYIGSRTGLSGGWRGFALEHKLDDGDALVFELTKPTRFKVYIIKAFDNNVQE
ncbi:B3 domain-containing protein Os05g0481400 isoform X2 [Aristolochia californica]|uniref:B3 domain-containing protein Os05g0481400 isoform X2 n=1 Tax=Aristolochia californica TaxID=171875 RepID=UPI0035D9C0A1